ncbi:MAG: methyltransferase domain-containing protein [Myxococcales bacterium]|nr:methyltransferase domain-containing protein [Myxococcales bacterium]
MADLEHHLPPEWWRPLFGAVYLKTDGDVVEDSTLTEVEVDDIVRMLELGPDDRILDLCCGQGRHSMELARRGHAGVVGIDRSRYLVRLARRRAKKEGLSLRFHEGDARRVGSRRERFDAALLLGNSFGYFDKADDDQKVLEGVRRVLRPGGKILMDVADGEWMRTNFEARSWEWLDASHFVCRERSLSADRSKLVSREVVVHSDKGVIVDQFYAERLYEAQAIEELLTRAGFVDIEQRDRFQTESARAQDLGMMAHRIRVSARAPESASLGALPASALRCTVLLGDPRLPDAVKPRGSFSQEDLETVRRLREALDTLGGMTFEYLDDHGMSLQDLRRRAPDLVINFCDEGYRNDPSMELHVPAYLEILGLPYTGGAPACLALCYDKEIVRAFAAQLDIAVPVETSIPPDDSSGTIPAIFPALLKPARGDSSVGITASSIVYSPREAVEAHTRLSAEFPGVPVLVQEYLTGSEYAVGLVGNPGFGYRVLPVLEVDYSQLPAGLPPILGYESKWHPDSPYGSKIRYVRARASDEAIGDMVSSSMKLFERLGCRDYARFDFRADAEGVIKLLEVNPNPGWCWDGKLNLMAGFEGASYADLLRWIIEAAAERVRGNGRARRP